MNSVIVVENGQQINVDLIAYFSSNNKKYLFYTKNESVQDGLIKMYVASQNTGSSENINDDEWTNLKKVMQGIIMGNSGVTFVNYSSPVTLNESRAIALKTDNIATIKNAYNSSVSNSSEVSGGTNKDLLAQNFGGGSNTSEPVQISSIPNVQNNFNMESTPVSLDTEVSQGTIDNIQENVNNLGNDVNIQSNSTPVIEPIATPQVPVTPDLSVTNAEPLSINSIKPMDSEVSNNNGIDSGFKVSNEPNIFDQPIENSSINSDNTISPFNITQEEVNKPIEESPIINNDILSPVSGINSVPQVNLQSDVRSNNVNDTNVKEKIELNERKIKLFEELANIYKEENELLKSGNDDSLEKTASDLFNNNGTLNELKVLEN